MPNPASSDQLLPRPPIVAVMGHIDHGKSSLLDAIRHTNETAGEAGGITQHISAYELETTVKSGKKLRMTFLDTPGHEAFAGVRERGGVIADIAVLVVAADDGVQPQTKEALQVIWEQGLPFIVAVNKIDKTNADVERTKQSLAQHEVYPEQYGGEVPLVEISATEPRGIDDLLEMIELVTEMQELKADPHSLASGRVLESSRDPKRGLSATLIITNGTLYKGQTVNSGSRIAPVRLMEDFRGQSLDQASFSSPVNIVGWSALPRPGARWAAHPSKGEAEQAAIEGVEERELTSEIIGVSEQTKEQTEIPVIIKADSQGGIEGIKNELNKLANDKAAINIVRSGIGAISESDAQFALASGRALIIGFNVKIDTNAQALEDREGLEIKTFAVIYQAAEWLAERIAERTPAFEERQTIGEARIVKRFSQSKNRQILGGKVKSGTIKVNQPVTIRRRETEIGTGQVTNLQHQKTERKEINEGEEFGAEIESRLEIQPGDTIEAFEMVKR